MITFSVPKDLLLYSHEMGTPSDFSVRGFSGGQGEDGSSMTFRRMAEGEAPIEYWTPAQITTALWLDASDGDTITLNGSAVIQWSDKSGNGRHVTQGTDSLRPTLGTNKIVFGGSHWLQNTTAQLPLDNFVCAIVFRETTATINAGCFSIKATGADWNSTDGLIFGPSSKSDKRTSWIGRGGDLQVNDTSSPASASPLAVYTIIKSVTSALFYRDGNRISTDTFTALSPLSKGGLVLGARTNPSVGSPYLRGEIMEIVYAPAAGQLRLDGYLAHKWDALLGVTALVDALPSDHPYKTAAPTIQPGQDPYIQNVALLLNATGEHGSTSIQAQIGPALIRLGDTRIDTSLGFASIIFDAAGDALHTGTVTSIITTEDFCIEAIVVPLSRSTDTWGRIIYSQYDYGTESTNRTIFCIYDNGTLRFSRGSFVLFSTTILAINTQYHVAVSRSGSSLRLFIDGVVAAESTSFSGTLSPVFSCISGAYYSGYKGSFSGHIRSLRVTKGVPRYTAPFTPPTLPFPTL